MKMEYEEFKNRLIRLVQEKLDGKAEASFVSREKENQTKKEGICIRRPGSRQHTVIYLQELFQSYGNIGNTAVFDRIADELINIFRKSETLPGEDALKDWERVKDKVQIRLVKKAWNEEKLKSWVHREFLDFAVVLAVELSVETDRLSSAPIERPLLEAWGISEEELYRTAAGNLNRERYYITDIDEFLPEKYPEEEQKLYVLQRWNNSYGAGLMLRDDILRQFAEEQGSSFYILPCSLHELILVKQEENTDVRQLEEIVKTANANTDAFKPEDRLSDNIYYYDREKGRIEIVQEKETGNNELSRV